VRVPTRLNGLDVFEKLWWVCAGVPSSLFRSCLPLSSSSQHTPSIALEMLAGNAHSAAWVVLQLDWRCLLSR
jgi:hypothetical protein